MRKDLAVDRRQMSVMKKISSVSGQPATCEGITSGH